jgi:hypothetical protein
MMFLDERFVGMRYRNFKILTHIVEYGAAPIQRLATPHLYNLTVDSGESTPYNRGNAPPRVRAVRADHRRPGARILVRLFAGLDFRPGDEVVADFAGLGYPSGVRMGGRLLMTPRGRRSPDLRRAGAA